MSILPHSTSTCKRCPIQRPDMERRILGSVCQLPVRVCRCVSGGRRGGEGRRRRLGTMALLLFVYGLTTARADAGNLDNVIDGDVGTLSAEVCQMSTFEASCATDEVVIIRSARLGRLQLGRCVKEQRFDIGCSLDVLPEMDHLCSGRQKCEVKVDDASFKRATPCSVDLKSHLWTSYDCVKVTLPLDGCDVLRLPSGILSSHVTEVTGCGVTESPWVIEVGQGQRINVTLYDFEFGVSHPASDEERSSGYAKSCRVYAIIRDTGERLGQTRTVCGGMERAINAFLSSSQRIEVRILTKSMVKPTAQYQNPHFLLHYTAIGCPTPVLSKDQWMKQTLPDTLTIGCDLVNLQWQLTCRGNEWKGSHGNCTTDKRTSAALGVPFAASTLIIVIIAIGVSSIILLIGVLCIKRKMRQERETRRLQTEAAVDHYADGDYSLGALSADKLTTVDPSFNTSSAIIADIPGNDYARMRLQRMTDYYAGSPQYGFDSQSYGGPGYKYPVVEHVYESPDSLRREDVPGTLVPHYMPRLHEQLGPPVPGAGEPEGFRPSGDGAPQVAHLGSSYRAAGPGAPAKAKNAGNYSL